MPLVQPTDNSFVPYLRCNAQRGEFTTKDAHGDEIVLPLPVIFIADFANALLGWLWYGEGSAPDGVYWRPGEQEPPRPSREHRRGCSLLTFFLEYGVREWQATSRAVLDAINPIYDEWAAADERQQGLLPVIECAAFTPVSNFRGETNHQPALRLIDWSARLPELPASRPLPIPRRSATSSTARRNGANPTSPAAPPPVGTPF
jgi:hypothetical protein